MARVKAHRNWLWLDAVPARRCHSSGVVHPRPSSGARDIRATLVRPQSADTPPPSTSATHRYNIGTSKARLHEQRVCAHRLRRCARREQTRRAATEPTHPTVDGVARHPIAISILAFSSCASYNMDFLDALSWRLSGVNTSRDFRSHFERNDALVVSSARAQWHYRSCLRFLSSRFEKAVKHKVGPDRVHW